MVRKTLIFLGGVIVALLVVGTLFVGFRQHLRFDAPYPDVKATSDTSIIARGHYIVRDLAPCASCHGDPAQREAFFRGDDVPLSGGYLFDIPPGKFYPRNLTPDVETGLAKPA